MSYLRVYKIFEKKRIFGEWFRNGINYGRYFERFVFGDYVNEV